MATWRVRAGGNGTASAPPQFQVFADGVLLGLVSIINPKSTPGFDPKDDSLFRDYVFEISGASPTLVEIRYINDGTTDGVNRDLVVDFTGFWAQYEWTKPWLQAYQPPPEKERT